MGFRCEISTETSEKGRRVILTVLEDAFDVQSIGGARFVIDAAAEIGGQLAGACVIDDAWVVLADGVCNKSTGKHDATVYYYPHFFFFFSVGWLVCFNIFRSSTPSPGPTSVLFTFEWNP